MAERTNIPNSTIPQSAACGQWETLLADALDGLLSAQDESVFMTHKANCQACAALLEEARQGREWLEFLSPEPEIPAGLVDRILARTGPGFMESHPVTAAAGVLLPAGGTLAWQRPGFMGSVRRWAEPRLMMTAAMAFFSIALTLNVTGVRLTQIRLSDLRPTAVRSFMERRLTMASVPIIRYYDHLHLMYEVQSRMRELRGDDAEAPQQNQTPPPGPGESKKKSGGSREAKPGQSGAPAQANGMSYGRFVDTALELRNQEQVEAGMGETNLPGKGQTPRQNIKPNRTGNTRTTLQNRAFRRLRNQAGRRASERSRVWTA